ncbi:MAG: protein-L-isoaspartate(D-aspartate) O-methyltransferase [bacterium]|nr:MAG: protein-L-isoaspartate(D-aspartate) O-methyltransferase [bacterium]
MPLPGHRNEGWHAPVRRVVFTAVVLAFAALATPAPSAGKDPTASSREAMVRTQIEARGIRDQAVLQAMRQVPRHRFVPEARGKEAYGDHPLPIGLGQTISQPYIVALMTELLALEEDHKLFELGTGSGYQAAVASRIAARVFTVEIYEQLAASAAARLRDLGYENVAVRNGDGYSGWPEEAPFDAIVVTAAADHIPPPLLEQLKPGGRMVIPLGNPFFVQQLVLVTKDAEGRIEETPVIPVRFVPLLGH